MSQRTRTHAHAARRQSTGRLKRIVSGIAAVALSLGLGLAGVVGTAGAAQADSYNWPAAKAGETCYSFDRTPFYNDPARVSGQTNGPVLVKLQGQYDSGHNWLVSSSGDPLATITVFANGGYQDRTGQTTLNGAYSADIMAANICTKAAPVVDPTPYVLVAWKMPTWVGPQTPTWNPFQSYFTKIDLASKDLNALDAQLTECNTQYQVDLYNDSATTTALIAGGKLYGPHNPAEDFPSPSGWDVTYKLVHVLACDSAADVAASTQPTCQAPGSVQFTISNADWNEAEDQTPGEHTRTATAWAGHTFPGGLTTKSITYTVPDKLVATGPDCFKPTPVKPNFSKITQCGTYGSIDIAGANANSATTHIQYAVTSGNGQSGWNTVTATAIDGYTLQAGAKSSWTVFLGVYFECYDPEVSYTLGACHIDDAKDSFKDLVVTLDNTGSTGGIQFSIVPAGISEWVNAGETEQVTISIPTDGASGYVVFAGFVPIKVIHAISEFETCIPIGLIGDPIVTPAICEAGEVGDGSIWVDRLEGLAYTLTGGPGAVNIVIEGLGTPGDLYEDGTVPLPPGDYVVVASALPGFVLDPLPPAEWDYTVEAPRAGCVITPPTVFCQLDEGGNLVLPFVANVLWSVNGAPAVAGPIPVHLAILATQITAVLSDPELTFAPGATSWLVGLDDEGACSFPTLADIPTNVQHTDPTCAAGANSSGTVTVGMLGGVSFFEEVNYYLDGSATPMLTPTASVAPGQHVVTASPVNPNDALDGPSTWEFTVAAAPAACDLTTLALTGTNPSGFLAIAAGLLLGGAALTVGYKLRRRTAKQ